MEEKRMTEAEAGLTEDDALRADADYLAQAGQILEALSLPSHEIDVPQVFALASAFDAIIRQKLRTEGVYISESPDGATAHAWSRARGENDVREIANGPIARVVALDVAAGLFAATVGDYVDANGHGPPWPDGTAVFHRGTPKSP